MKAFLLFGEPCRQMEPTLFNIILYTIISEKPYIFYINLRKHGLIRLLKISFSLKILNLPYFDDRFLYHFLVRETLIKRE